MSLKLTSFCFWSILLVSAGNAHELEEYTECGNSPEAKITG